MEQGLAFLVIVGFCLALSFLLSGMEAGVFALSRLRVRQQMRAGRRRAEVLHGYLENPEHFLWTILIGNTLATFAAFSLVVLGLYHKLNERPVLFLLSFLLAAFFFYVFFDLLPKMLFRLFPNRLCLLLAVPFRFIYLALSPLVRVVTLISDGLLRLTGGKSFTGHLFGSRSELRSMMQESAHPLTTEERAMIDRVLELQNITVRSVAVPIGKVVAVAVETPVREILSICQEQNVTRLPVWQSSRRGRKIVGLVSLKDLLYIEGLDPEKPSGAYVKAALYLREDLRLEEALRRMQRSGQRLAIVLALDQRELGIVTLQDILRAVFGEVSL